MLLCKKGAVTSNDKIIISICRLMVSLLNFPLKKSELMKPLNMWQVFQTLNHFCSPIVNPLHFVSLLSKKNYFKMNLIISLQSQLGGEHFQKS